MMTRTRSPVAAVRHGLIVLAAAWQGLWLLSEWLGGSPRVAVLLASFSWIALVAAIWLERFRNQLIAANIGLLAAGVGYLVLDSAQQGRGITATTVLTGLIGLLVASRPALVLVVAVVVVEFIGLVSIGQLGIDDVLGVAYAFAIGIGALLARRALIRGAAQAMAAQQAAADRAVEARAMEQVATDLLATERVVHATVLNTLTALARGAVSDTDVTRERAAQAAEVLDALTSGGTFAESSTSLSDEFDRQAGRLRAAGLHVELARPKQMPALSGDAEEALRGALDEAVTNILRHAKAQHVQIRAVSRARGIRISIRDDGTGIGRDSPPRIGLKDVIFAGVESAGGSVTLRDTAPGTEVVLNWQEQVERGADAANARSLLAQFVAPFLLVFWAFVTLRVVATWNAFESPLFNALAYAIFTALVVFVARRSQLGPLRLGVIATVLLATPMIYQLQKLGAPIGERPEWASEAIASLFIVVIGAGSAWAWPAVIGVWLLIQGDIRAELLAPGFAILLAIGLFAVSFRRNTRRAAAADDELVESRVRQVASRSAVASIRGRAAIAERAKAADLLRGIASGAIDPGDGEVRAECAAEEQLLRVAMRLDPSRYALHEVLGGLAVEAYDRGLVLDVDVAATDAFDTNVASFEALTRQLIAEAQPGCVIRVTTQQGKDEWILLCVFEGAEFTGSVYAPEGIEVAHMPDEHMLLVEWKVQDAVSHR